MLLSVFVNDGCSAGSLAIQALFVNKTTKAFFLAIKTLVVIGVAVDFRKQQQ